MRTVFIHRHASILSAYGLALADVVHELQTPVHCHYAQENYQLLHDQLAKLCDEGRQHMAARGFADVECEPYLHMRYDRTDCALMCLPGSVR